MTSPADHPFYWFMLWTGFGICVTGWTGHIARVMFPGHDLDFELVPRLLFWHVLAIGWPLTALHYIVISSCELTLADDWHDCFDVGGVPTTDVALPPNERKILICSTVPG